MKRFLLIAVFMLVSSLFSFGNHAKAEIVKYPKKLDVTFTGTHIQDIPHTDFDPPLYDHWRLGYRFTIFNAENCKTKIKIQMMHLSGRYMSLSIKEFVGNMPNRTAEDVTPVMQRTYRLYFENTEGECQNIHVKGTYGPVPDPPFVP
ncbi:hypothetical protein PJ311_07395 [Bacillus sp. CLL-7-23]|uniref:Uncharacterized protein n=1 Tax=Bacillus changyiensis TaxID=3004103 RepID=A0ABT4X2M6_9BACI|nr:hypothetical protein [Bacillus changyiensis]MDA7026440.1 hypothetical protein [Bacillus changyiensis]